VPAVPVQALKLLFSNPSLKIGEATSIFVCVVVPDVVIEVIVEVAEVVVVWLVLVAVVAAN
jgi:hypothetical protein